MSEHEKKNPNKQLGTMPYWLKKINMLDQETVGKTYFLCLLHAVGVIKTVSSVSGVKNAGQPHVIK